MLSVYKQNLINQIELAELVYSNNIIFRAKQNCCEIVFHWTWKHYTKMFSTKLHDMIFKQNENT